jgi:hypothetical protein
MQCRSDMLAIRAAAGRIWARGGCWARGASGHADMHHHHIGCGWMHNSVHMTQAESTQIESKHSSRQPLKDGICHAPQQLLYDVTCAPALCPCFAPAPSSSSPVFHARLVAAAAGRKRLPPPPLQRPLLLPPSNKLQRHQKRAPALPPPASPPPLRLSNGQLVASLHRSSQPPTIAAAPSKPRR